MNDIRAVLTDIGDVVIEIHSERTAKRLADAAGVSVDQVLRLLDVEPYVVRKVNDGQWTMREVYDRCLDSLRPAVSMELFLDAWDDMLGEDFPEVREAYDRLPEPVALYTLSNTNDRHMRTLRRHWLFDRSREFWASNEIGLSKPSAEAFAFVIERIAQPPGQVLFFDDLEENVVAAREAGLSAVQVTRPAVVPETLRKAGLL